MPTAEELKTQFNVTGSNAENIENIANIGTTPQEAFSGLVGESDEVRTAREAVGSGYQTDADIVIDEDAIRRSTTEKFQSEIDALNKVFDEKKRIEAIAGEGRLGETGAIQARRGLLGSDFGASLTEGQRSENVAKQNVISADRASQLQAIQRDIRNSVDAEVKAKEQAKKLGSSNYLAFLRDTGTRKKQFVSDAVKNVIARAVVPTEADFNSLAEQLGVSVDDVKADYQTQFDASELAKQTAEALGAKEALGARKTEAEIAKLEGEAGLKEAEAGFKDRETAQFDIDNLAKTDKVRADFEQQAFDNKITLRELRLSRDKYETDTDFNNANLELDTAKAQASVDKIYNDIENTGKMTPLQQAQLQKLQGEVIEKQALADKAKIQSGRTADVVQTKIDSIDKLLREDSGLNLVVGLGVLGRTPLIDKLSRGLISDPRARAFSSGIRQLISQETLDTLKNLKASGATLGAISEKELAILQGAASQINDWEVLDDDGKPTGKYNIDEPTFRAELEKIKLASEVMRDAARADSEAGEGKGNQTTFTDMNDFLDNASSQQEETVNNLVTEFPYLEDPDNQQELIDMINSQSNQEVSFNRVDSDTNTAISNVNLGSRLARVNNNPGNLRLAGQRGASDGEGGFARFNTPEEGVEALRSDIRAKITGNSPAIRGKLGRDAETLLDVISVFAPKEDSNDPNSYAQFVAKQLGISPNEPVANLVNRIDELTRAFAQKESSSTFA